MGLGFLSFLKKKPKRVAPGEVWEVFNDAGRRRMFLIIDVLKQSADGTDDKYRYVELTRELPDVRDHYLSIRSGSKLSEPRVDGDRVYKTYREAWRRLA